MTQQKSVRIFESLADGEIPEHLRAIVIEKDSKIAHNRDQNVHDNLYIEVGQQLIIFTFLNDYKINGVRLKKYRPTD